jgi:predicted nuclease with RNAse H fold
MCAEKDPLDCHRTILVARELIKRGLSVTHILEDGASESHADSISRLVNSLGMSLDDMFSSQQEIVDDAYARQASRIAYDQGERQSKTSTGRDSTVVGETVR